MRKLLLLMLCFLPLVSSAQVSTSDYEVLMRRFVSYYNSDNTEGIGNMFSDDLGKQKFSFFNKEVVQQMKTDYGKIISYKYVTIDSVSDRNRIVLFKVVSERKPHATGFTINKKKQFETFRFATSSPYIDSLMSRF